MKTTTEELQRRRDALGRARREFVAWTGGWGKGRPTLAGLARQYDLSVNTVRTTAIREGWHLEQSANQAKAWFVSFGGGARTAREHAFRELASGRYALGEADWAIDDRIDLWNRNERLIQRWEIFKAGKNPETIPPPEVFPGDVRFGIEDRPSEYNLKSTFQRASRAGFLAMLETLALDLEPGFRDGRWRGDRDEAQDPSSRLVQECARRIATPVEAHFVMMCSPHREKAWSDHGPANGRKTIPRGWSRADAPLHRKAAVALTLDVIEIARKRGWRIPARTGTAKHHPRELRVS